MANFNATYLTSPNEELLVQSPAEAIYLAPSSVTVSANIRYYQRVYSSGLSAWCYYNTLNAVNPAPASSATTPNWTGSIAGFEVVGRVAVP